jgi:hypothetical protein
MRFDGWIAGLGTRSGTRIVLGHWPTSPFGPVSDVMLESSDGHRRLLASSAELAEFVAATYTFDEVIVTPVDVIRSVSQWNLRAGALDLRFDVGRRGGLGMLLRAVPAPLARSARWVELIDLPARVVMPGVRTHGTAGNGRHEWYGARDLHPISAAGGTLDGTPLEELTDVDPPVTFGFGSTPRTPSLVRIVTTIRL